MIPSFSLIALLATETAAASSLDAEHFSVGIPFEAALVGLSFGVHPELLWRPFNPDGRAHVRASAGALVGHELAMVPLSLGVREVFRPTRNVRPGIGMGVQAQNFFPYGHERVTRLDQYYEFTLDVRVNDQWRVGLELSPEFGWVGGFGLGMATRIGVKTDLPLSR